jgi:hypothetical protein
MTTTPNPRSVQPDPVPESAQPCRGVTYVSVGLPDVDGPWEQTAECDDVDGCGFRVLMSEVGRPDGSWDTAISSDEFLPLHQQHLDHRLRTTGRRCDS